MTVLSYAYEFACGIDGVIERLFVWHLRCHQTTLCVALTVLHVSCDYMYVHVAMTVLSYAYDFCVKH